MVNLFQRHTDEQGSLTAALLVLLEHADRGLLNRFLQLSGIEAQVGKGAAVSVHYPVPDAPPGTGRLDLPEGAVAIAARAPGDPWRLTGPIGGAETIAITPEGAPLPDVHTLSWEQVDRWLTAMAEEYDPETRTGFLLDQFRSFLPEAGIVYFAGFGQGLLEQAPSGLDTLTEFYQTADQFFEQLTPSLTAAHQELAQVRQARPEDLLVGYSYRDYSGAAQGPDSFLRVAFHLARRELQMALWLTPGADLTSSHRRLYEALRADEPLLESLQTLEGHPTLRLWSAAGEHFIPLDELQPDRLEALDWPTSHVAVQRSLSFERFPETGLIGQVTTLTGELVETLSPILAPTLH